MSPPHFKMHEKRQLNKRQPGRTVRAVYPTHREVLLARLLLQVIDSLGERVAYEPDLYNEVKLITDKVFHGEEQ